MPFRKIEPSEARTDDQFPNPPRRRPPRSRPQQQPNENETGQISTSSDKSYAVGYGKPPKATQFKKGKSGNPNGRPKGAKGLNSIVKRQLLERVSVRTGKGTKRVSRIEALVLKLLESAGSGDHRALVQLISMYADAVPEAVAEQGNPQTQKLSRTDEAILAQFLAQNSADKDSEK